MHFYQIPVWLLCIPVNSGVHLGLLPVSLLPLKKGRMVRTDANVPWSSTCISLEVFLGSLSVILTILIFNVGSIFLFQPRPGRLATLPWTYYGHIAFTIDMLVYSLHAIYTDEALLSLVHVQRGAHDNAKQVDHLSLFK